MTTMKSPQDAFEQAIKAHRLSDRPDAWNYAGNFMYMLTDENGVDQFKNVQTRNYLRNH